MNQAARRIEPGEIMALADYLKERAARRRAIQAIKRPRRVTIGPDATLYFENYDTMFYQVHEMLAVEKGGAAQIAGELEAYNPLIPNGFELVATVMIEIGDAVRRARVLAGLGGFEETISIAFDGEKIVGVAEVDADRTTASGKASSVQFVHFPFTRTQIEKFRRPVGEIVVAIGHPAYRHMTVLSEEARAALARDFAH